MEEAFMEGGLTPAEFDTHLAEGTFRLSFVGMSNAGKSYRSKKLRDDNDFLWYQVDDEIEKELGLGSMEAVSAWLGFPDSDGYAERERRYLELENTYTKHASMQTNGKNFVFDTTGSVAHLAEGTLKTLQENCLVVHLDVGEDSLETMMDTYIREPKPVAWCGYFNREPGESKEEAFRRCYPTLLAERLKRYRKLAHLTIPTKELRDTTGDETLAIIKRYLV